MKKYIAQKAMKFDKKYQKGEEIPESVIAPQMISKLIRCGSIAVIEVAETEQQNEQTNQNSEEKEQETEQLLQYKKEELEQMAKDMGIEIKQSMTKADIVELLLQKE